MRLAGDIFRRKAPVEVASQLLDRPLVAPVIPAGKPLKYGLREEPGPARFGQAFHEFMLAGGQV